MNKLIQEAEEADFETSTKSRKKSFKILTNNGREGQNNKIKIYNFYVTLVRFV